MESDLKIQLGILGENISYTKSPLLHSLINNHRNVNLEYKIYDIPKNKFENNLNDELRKIDGFNITIPYKEKIIPYLDYIDPVAKQIGAINTVVVKNKRFFGYNTDIIGFIKTVKLHIKEFNKYFPVLIGYGGVSKAVIFGLEKLGFSQCAVIGGLNDSERENIIRNISPSLQMKIVNMIPSDLPKLWINATPIGTNKFPNIPNDFIKINANDFLLDLNYSPNPTYLQKWFDNIHHKVAKSQMSNNVKSVNGIYMLIYQGIASEEIWFPKINFVNLNIRKIIGKM